MPRSTSQATWRLVVFIWSLLSTHVKRVTAGSSRIRLGDHKFNCDGLYSHEGGCILGGFEHGSRPIRLYRLNVTNRSHFRLQHTYEAIEKAPRVPGLIHLVVPTTTTAHARLVFGPGSGAMCFLQRYR